MSVKMEFHNLNGVSFTYKYTDEPVEAVIDNYDIDISLDDVFLDENEILSEEEFNSFFDEIMDDISEEMIKAAWYMVVSVKRHAKSFKKKCCFG